jgi:hypothetical protein
VANFLEKVSNRVRIYASSAQKEQRGHWQRNPARTKKTVNQFFGVQCEGKIFRQSRGLREGKTSLHRNFLASYQNG